MDFGHEEFQDGMAQCTESSLAVRRALACLNHRWHTKVRTSFLKQEELKVCVEDCTYENVRFILRLEAQSRPPLGSASDSVPFGNSPEDIPFLG